MTVRKWMIIGLASAVALAGRLSLAGPPDERKKPEAQPPKDEKDKKPAAKDLEPGKPVPDFTLKGCDGKTYKLADYKDKIVVVSWYNFECPYIKRYGKDLQQLGDKYTKKGVVWLAIDSTGGRTNEQNAEHLKKTKRTFPILLDPDGKVGHAYVAKTTPHMFIINKGELAYRGALLEQGGEHKWVEEATDALLAGKPVARTKTQPFG